MELISMVVFKSGIGDDDKGNNSRNFTLTAHAKTFDPYSGAPIISPSKPGDGCTDRGRIFVIRARIATRSGSRVRLDMRFGRASGQRRTSQQGGTGVPDGAGSFEGQPGGTEMTGFKSFLLASAAGTV